MSNHMSVKTQKNKPQIGVVIWCVMTAIMFAAAYASLPVSNVKNLQQYSAWELGNIQKQWVVLEGEDYIAGSQFDTFRVHDSTIMTIVSEYPCFHIKTTDKNGQTYWLAARASTETYRRIVSGENVKLYGTILPLSESQIARQQGSKPVSADIIVPYVLCDSGKTPMRQYLESILFFLAGILFALLTFLVWKSELLLKNKKI